MIRVKTWQVPEIWKGEDVWIIGGGSSLLSCFDIPASVVDEVRLRKIGIEAYSPYLAAIHAKHVIGVNVAYQFGNWIDLCFFGDKKFFLMNRAGLSRFRKLVVTSCERVGQENLSWVKYLPNEKKVGVPNTHQEFGISTTPSKVSWNKNSGAASISIAAWSGAKRIILVGFDMTLDLNSKESHFHNNYESKTISVSEKRLTSKNSTFETHLKGWAAIKQDADNMGIEILNTSLNSAIKEIPKVHIKELL